MAARALSRSDAPKEFLERLGGAADSAVPLADAALALAQLDRPDTRPEAYLAFLATLAADLAAAGAGLVDAGDRAACLAQVVALRYRFRGDEGEDDGECGSLMETIDRRRGGPEALGILYIEAARRVGWACDGLSFPGHFLVRLEDPAGGRAIIDPFAGGAIVDAPTMRALLKAGAGLAAELKPQHYAPLGNRAILVRLQNELKLRRLRQGRVAQALSAVEAALLFAPGETLLWREAGLLHMRMENFAAAIAALEHFATHTANAHARRRALALVREIKGRMHQQ